MKKTILALGLLSAAALGTDARAYWIGNPGLSIDNQKSAIEFIYDTGGRDIVPDGGGTAVELESRRLYANWRYGLARDWQIVGRFLPGMGRIDLENSNFNPTMWGAGLQLQFSPREKLGPLRVGVSAAYDLSYGKKGRDKLSWDEGTFALGASYAPAENFRLYGGLDIIKSNFDFEFNNFKANFNEDESVGLFFGLNLLPSDGWVIGAELHVINETVFGVNLRYRF